MQIHTGKQGFAQAAKQGDFSVAKRRLAFVSIEVDRQQTAVFPHANQRSTFTRAVTGVNAAAMLGRNFVRMAVLDRRFTAFEPVFCRIEGLIAQVNSLAVEMKRFGRLIRRPQACTPVKQRRPETVAPSGLSRCTKSMCLQSLFQRPACSAAVGLFGRIILYLPDVVAGYPSRPTALESRHAPPP